MPLASSSSRVRPADQNPGHRRWRAGAVAVVVAALALTGCSGGSGGTEKSSGALSKVSVSTKVPGKLPTVKVDAPLKVTKTTREVLTTGTGRVAKTGDAVVARLTGINARTGKGFGNDFGSTPVSFVLGDKVLKGFAKTLTGVKAGSRVLAAVTPADGYGPSGGVSDLKIRKTDSLVYVIDVIAVTDARATGTAVKPPSGLPAVALAANGEPTLTVPAGVAPASTLVAQPLIDGSGPAVAKGQYITVQYTGVIYGSGKVFDSSWTRGSPATFQIGTGQVIPGWDAALVGAKVGSQLLLVVPPAQGYGSAGNTGAGIAGTDTLIFVVDILAATT